jgi:pimeloyl-ACP methyl ester carboxylesterase
MPQMPKLDAREAHFRIASDTPGLDLFLRYLAPSSPQTVAKIVLYVHGATFPSGLSIAHRFGGHSWRDDLNAAGFDVWGLDFVGFGGSERYSEMSQSPENQPPLGRAEGSSRQIEKPCASFLPTIASLAYLSSRTRGQACLQGASRAHILNWLTESFSLPQFPNGRMDQSLRPIVRGVWSEPTIRDFVESRCSRNQSRPAAAMSATRSALMLQISGWPNNRLYRRLNWLALLCPTSKAAVAASKIPHALFLPTSRKCTNSCNHITPYGVMCH